MLNSQQNTVHNLNDRKIISVLGTSNQLIVDIKIIIFRIKTSFLAVVMFCRLPFSFIHNLLLHKVIYRSGDRHDQRIGMMV